MRNPATYAGITLAIDYLNRIGWEAIVDHEREMATLLKQRLSAIEGVVVQTPMAFENSSAIVNFAVHGVTGQNVSERFWNDYRIVQRAVRVPNGVRLSTAYFSGPQDIERVVEAMTAIRSNARG